MKRSALYLAMAMSLPMAAQAGFLEDIQINGYLKNETAFFIQNGQMTGEARTMLDDRHHDNFDLMKFENSARFFVNGDIGEESSWHLDLNIICDTEGVNSDYQCHRNYTQYDWLRELYLDTSISNLSLRIGKQQVVWGVADGAKILDIINPVDFREMSQNMAEESRIPIWMLNAELPIGETGNVQFIVSEARKNQIAGLNDNDDKDHPFIFKGVDSITGNVNGFLHITPALASVAGSFNTAAFAGMFTGAINPYGLLPFAGMTVDGFAGQDMIYGFECPPTGCDGTQQPTAFGPGYIVLNNIAQNGLYEGDPNANNNVTNLMDVYGEQPYEVTWDPANPTSAFEYMPNATFATFNTFTHLNEQGMMVGADTVYKTDDPSGANAGLRYRGSLENGLNFSLNYFYHYSNNPEINLSWHDSVTGEELNTSYALGMVIGTDPAGNPVIAPNPGNTITADQIGTDAMTDLTAMPTVLLSNSAGQYYGAFDPTTFMINENQNGVTMRMTETRSRVNTFGITLDYSTQVGNFPLIMRFEAAYDQDERQPVVDKKLLAIGDLVNALTMEDMDRFSYVIGLDTNIMTNMMASFQFIQYINLDFVDDQRTCTTQTGVQYDCSRYTGDFATLHLTNGLNKGWEYKEYYSLFLSKPFGEGQLGRWHNVFMWEDGGGYWDQFGIEYSFSDELVGSGQINLYGGDEDTTFGQFKESSNLQIGLKYIWE